MVYLTHTVRIEEGNVCSFPRWLWVVGGYREGAGVIESTIII